MVFFWADFFLLLVRSWKVTFFEFLVFFKYLLAFVFFLGDFLLEPELSFALSDELESSTSYLLCPLRMTFLGDDFTAAAASTLAERLLFFALFSSSEGSSESALTFNLASARWAAFRSLLNLSALSFSAFSLLFADASWPEESVLRVASS